MNEKQKMQLGILYNPNDEALMNERTNAKSQCSQFNQSGDIKILEGLLKKVGENVTILPSFFCDYGYNIELGDHFFSNHNLVLLDAAKIKIGNNVLIGQNCGLYTANHPLDVIKRRAGLEDAQPIEIGNDVWIGGNVCVLPGVKIGSNVVIGAGSVITHDIPSNVVAFGNPCKVMKSND